MSEKKFLCAQIIWDYMKREDPLEKVDLILVLGSHDPRVAEYGAQLCLDGWAPCIMFSGGLGNLTKATWTSPEAEAFKEIAMGMGVPQDKIITESQSSNSGENVQFSYQVLESLNKVPNSVILVQKPYMLRRTFATFMKQWPGDVTATKMIVTCQPISLQDYPNQATGGIDDVINIMLGDLKRIDVYVEKGFQIPQYVPDEVWKAYHQLCDIMKRDKEKLLYF